jgi:hypothetical protein
LTNHQKYDIISIVKERKGDKKLKEKIFKKVLTFFKECDIIITVKQIRSLLKNLNSPKGRKRFIMTNYEINKEMTITKVKNAVKAELTTTLINALKEEYGEDNVAMVRIGSSPTNVVAVRCAVATDNGFDYDVCAVINPTAKDFEDRVSDKGKKYEAFDFEEAKVEYERYVQEK